MHCLGCLRVGVGGCCAMTTSNPRKGAKRAKLSRCGRFFTAPHSQHRLTLCTGTSVAGLGQGWCMVARSRAGRIRRRPPLFQPYRGTNLKPSVVQQKLTAFSFAACNLIKIWLLVFSHKVRYCKITCVENDLFSTAEQSSAAHTTMPRPCLCVQG